MPKPVVSLLAGLSVVAVASSTLLVSGAAAGGVADKPGVRSPFVAEREAGGNALLPVGENSIRIFGDDRFQTAVSISQEYGWGPEAPASTVYLATGAGFADALAIGLSNYDDGPLLLTNRDALPAVTLEEIRRLQPCTIVVLGGTGVISDAVAEAADAETVACDF